MPTQIDLARHRRRVGGERALSGERARVAASGWKNRGKWAPVRSQGRRNGEPEGFNRRISVIRQAS